MTDDFAVSPNFARDLLAWYGVHAAALPWRTSHDPYRVWLAEIMLQQTQTATVAPYYARFLDRFPTVEALAAAPIDAVLKAWEGLGYYSRARNLHRAAQQIVAERAGQFPTTAAEWETLPGIGRYTAGAIASIAYGEQVAALDGNAIRVLSRIADVPDDVAHPATVRRLWALAESLVPIDHPGAYNQAIMDLGRTVCTSKSPRCGVCPVSIHCRAYQAGSQAQRPVKAPRAPTPHYDVSAGFIRNRTGEILIAQRPTEGLLGGLWALPGGTCAPGESPTDCLRRTLNASESELKIDELAARVQHAFTHFRMTLHVYWCRWESERESPDTSAYADRRWVLPETLDSFAFARADRRALDSIRQTSWLDGSS
ncbi:MAG: A/G-specific adenine glycosylase [Aggregatilineales bacterium]